MGSCLLPYDTYLQPGNKDWRYGWHFSPILDWGTTGLALSPPLLAIGLFNDAYGLHRYIAGALSPLGGLTGVRVLPQYYSSILSRIFSTPMEPQPYGTLFLADAKITL